jgi:tetratricopeptide (TPR) repeat protein
MSERWVAALLWVAALGLRCLYIFQSDASPFFDFPLVDAKTYTDTAAHMAAQGEWGGGDKPFWQPPLYPYFLGLIYALSEPGYYIPRLVQAALGAFNCLLVYFVGRRVFSHSIGLAAGALAALYGPFIFFDAEFLPPALALCFDLLLLLALPWAVRGGHGRLLLTGFLFGLAALCIANILLFLPCAAAWVYWQKRDLDGPRRLLALLPLLLGVALAIAPVTGRNYLRGDWVLISSNAGINFYIGNNADYDNTVRMQPGPAWRALVTRPRLEADATQPSQQSLFFFGQAWQFMRSQPGAYLRLLLHKVYLLGHGNEIGRNQDLYFARQYSPLLAALLWKSVVAFPFGVLAPLALVGIVLLCRRGRWREPGPALLLLFLGTYALSIVLFFVTARYRLPLVPVLLLFAVFAVREAWGLLQEGRRALVSGLGAAVVVLLVLNNRGLEAMNMAGDADTQHRLGFVFQQKGLEANAIDAYQRALVLDPSIQEARFNLGSLYALRGDYRRAEIEYRAFIARHPEHGEAPYALANVLLDMRRYVLAAELYEKLLDKPSGIEQSEIGLRLAHARLQLGQPQAAEATYRRLLRSRPDLLQVRFMLGKLYESQANNAAAAQEYEQVLRRDPSLTEVRYRLAYVLFQQERPAEAEAHLHQLIKQEPHSIEARWLLAKQYVAEHKGAEALEQVEAILVIEPAHVQANRMAGHLHVIRGDTLTGTHQLELFKKLHVEERSKEIQEQLLDKWRKDLGGAQ